MRSTASLDIQIGNTDIPIKIYSAVEQETHFKQVSVCCNSAVNYKKVCSSCQAELSQDQIKKALEVGDELKQVNSEIVKVENSNLKVLGIISDENEENGLFRDGLVWFIGFETEKKNKGKHERNLTKFSYLRESLRASGVSLLCLVNVRGKEHIILLKPYFNAFIGIGLYHFDRIRDVKEIAGYSESIQINQEMVKQMSENIKQKDQVNINSIENQRNKLIERALTSETNQVSQKEAKEENLLELCSF